MTRFWIGVACKEHVEGGVVGGFAQVCHGKAGPLNQMQPGDWLVYYSPTIKFMVKEPCQSFTAIGKIKDGDPYPFAMSENFIPWRRDVVFFKSKEIPIQTLLHQLSFIKDRQRWGYPFRRGCFEISEKDFHIIGKAMGVCIG